MWKSRPFFADEGHQVAGVLELAARAIAAGQSPRKATSRRPCLEHSQLFTHRLPRGANAREWEAALTPSERSLSPW
jgi:hypothetical protein